MGTVRTEWASGSRNPDPHYLNVAARMLRQLGFFVVSVADTEPCVEWIVGPAPAADLTLHKGDLSLTQLCTLYEHAACVVSPVGFSIPGWGQPNYRAGSSTGVGSVHRFLIQRGHYCLTANVTTKCSFAFRTRKGNWKSKSGNLPPPHCM